MVKKSIFFIIFLWSVNVYAQEYHKLILDNDTINGILKMSRKNGENIVSFKKPYEIIWHKIDANNANMALVSDKEPYLSVKLPDTEDKVWVKCVFDGTYKLLRYKNFFYIVEPDNSIIKLDYSSGQKNRFKGMLISIFENKIDFNYNLLSYDSKSLVLPLIKYHQDNKLPYYDYVPYAPVRVNYDINAGVAYNTYTLYIRWGTDHTIKKVNPYVGANITFGISKHFAVSTGLSAEYINIDDSFVTSGEFITFYDAVLVKGFDISLPIMLKYDIVQRKNIFVQLGSGLKLSKLFTSDSELKTQTLMGNTIQTNTEKIGISNMNFFQHNELVLKCPAFTNNFSLGTTYSYSFQKHPENITHGVPLSLYSGNSLSAFVRYTFK